ncbi:jg7565, partial [Pararge aegeria aegeria]
MSNKTLFLSETSRKLKGTFDDVVHYGTKTSALVEYLCPYNCTENVRLCGQRTVHLDGIALTIERSTDGRSLP